MGYDFKQKEVAQYLKRLAIEGTEGGTFDNTYSNRSFNDTQRSCLVKVGDSGLPKRVDFDPPLDPLENSYQLVKGTCKMIDIVAYVDPNAGPAPNFLDKSEFDLKTVNRTTAATFDGSSISEADIDVVNVTDEDVDPGEWVIVTQIGGQWVYAGAKKSGRIRIALKTSIIDGAATAWILDQPTENEGEFAEMQVTDPRKQFYGAIGTEEPTRQDLSACSADLTYYAEKPGGIGWASYSPTSASWEIESMTLPIQRFKAEVPGGVASPSQKFSGIESEPAKSVYFNPEDSLSPYPHVDMPPEVTCNPGAENVSKKLMVQALNPHRFTIMPGSEVTIERRIKEVPASEYDATSYNPHDNAIPSAGVIRGYEWVIVDAEKTIARWAKFKTINGSQNCEWKYDDSASSFKEGHDPLKYFGSDVAPGVEDDVTVQAATDIGGCACDDGASQSPITVPVQDTTGWGFWDNNESKYNVVATKSALLGPPECDFIKDISGGSGTDCNLGITKVDGQVGWDAGSSSSNIEISLSTREIKYMSNLSGGCNVICPTFEYATVLNCEPNTGGYVSCMNIYADPCVTCSGTCNWIGDSVGGGWSEDPDNPHTCVPDSDDCGCEGQEPDRDSDSGETETTPCAVNNSPPEPPPCENCSECVNKNMTINSLSYNSGAPIGPGLGTGAQYEMDPDTLELVGDCLWEVTVTWTEQTAFGGPSTLTPVTATIELSNGTWFCAVPDAPVARGTGCPQETYRGSWSYTPPAATCSPALFQNDFTEPGLSLPSTAATLTFSASGPDCTT